jgi:hypothetical protein
MQHDSIGSSALRKAAPEARAIRSTTSAPSGKEVLERGAIWLNPG